MGDRVGDIVGVTDGDTVGVTLGDVVGAIGFNWFGPLSMAVAVIVTAIALWTALTGGGALRRVQHVLTGRIAMSVLVVWLGYGLVRILDAGFGWGLFPLVV